MYRIREIYKVEQPIFDKPVEIDVTFVGGKEKNKHSSKRTIGIQRRSAKTKTLVLGILEREGKIYAIPTKDSKAKTILPIIEKM